MPPRGQSMFAGVPALTAGTGGLPVCAWREGVLRSPGHSLWRPVLHKQLGGLWGLSPDPSPGRA